MNDNAEREWDLEWEREETHAIRDALLKLNERHEQEAHDGEPCADHRIGLIAFLSHSLGLAPEHLTAVAVELIEYEAAHAQRHGNGREH